MKKVKFTLAGFKESKVSEWVIRFVFGGCVSVLANLVTKYWGADVGGLFLAFPSILPATLTLIVHHRSREDASEDAFGAALGSIGLLGFAATVLFTLELWPVAWAFSAATGVWFLVSALSWYVSEW